MADIPGNSSTTATIGVGDTVSGTLESLGDHDWFRITLTAGQSITVFVDGITLEDPYLYIRNSAGSLLFENDDINTGVNRDSQLSFTATYTGTYYIDIGAWNEDYTGDYQVSVSVYSPPPLATYDQIADQLVEGYWGGDSHAFNVSQGGSITVNLTALTPAGQNLAREALKLWSDVIGVQFVEVTSGGQMTFDDNQSGAFSDGSWVGGVITSSHVNVSSQWLAQYGTGLNSYSFQTYVHEIGHALGLGHAGNYNGSATYPYDASFQNDAWVTSIMSYFSPTENTYFAGQGFTENFVVTPMMADIVAMSMLYGLSTTTRTGDTTYGFNSNAGRAVYDAAANPTVAYTIFDSGGTDTLDYSGFGTNQVINLNPETFSSVGTRVGNVSIARGVIIENAIGGSGNDSLTGNAAANVLAGNAGNDTLNGGAGADSLIGGLGNDVYVVDQVGDAISEVAGQGEDIVVAKASYTLGAGVSVETLTTINASATTAIDLSGNDLAQSLYGNAGDNVLRGFGGSDFLVGQAGNDSLLGGTGTDNMDGGAGNDVYYADTGDRIFEIAGEGEDIVVATASFALNDGAAIETLVADPGSAPIDLSGNEFGQSLYGNLANNYLFGAGGSDYLLGFAGNDSLLGGPGIDNMEGGAGNDVYYADTGDRIFELVGEGEDIVVATASFALNDGAAIETLVADPGTAAIDLSGNEFGQSLYGNTGNNYLFGAGGSDYLLGFAGNDSLLGGAGSDNLAGGAGNDIYYVDSGDQIIEAANEGDDLAVLVENFVLGAGQSVETLSAAEDAGAIALTGNAFSQSLYGNASANVLTGGGGADYLVGREGADTFVLASPTGGVATIADYEVAEVVDITQLLSVGGGTDLVGGGYVRVTAGGQLQVDADGGGDAYVTLANVSGSSSVTIRYLAAGAATDITVARSASQSMAMAVAAAGMAALIPAETKGVDPTGIGSGPTTSDVGLQTQALTPSLDGGNVVALSGLISTIGGAAPDLAESALLAAAAQLAPAVFDAAPVAAPAPTFLAATDVPNLPAMSGAIAAPAVAMPAPAQLGAMVGTVDGAAQHSQIVEQVLADALDGAGGKASDLDTLLAGLAGAPVTAPGQLAALVDGHAFAAAPLGDAFALEALVMHHDAPPAA